MYLVIKPVNYFWNKHRDIRISENQLKYLRGLTNYEKHLIRQMLSCPGYTMELTTNNGMVIKLQSSFVISPAGTTHLVDAYDMRIPFFVQPWVVKMTVDNPDIGI